MEVVGNVGQCDQCSDDGEQNVSDSALESSCANAGSVYDIERVLLFALHVNIS